MLLSSPKRVFLGGKSSAALPARARASGRESCPSPGGVSSVLGQEAPGASPVGDYEDGGGLERPPREDRMREMELLSLEQRAPKQHQMSELQNEQI